MKKYVFILLSLISVCHGQPPTASELIEKYRQTMKKIESISYDYLLSRKGYDSTISSTPQIEKFKVQVKTDGNRVDHRARIWANYADRDNPDIECVEPREKSFMWDGDSFYTYRWMSEGSNTNSRAFIERNDNEKQAHLAIDDVSGPLRGIMYGDFDRIDIILNKSDSLKVSRRKEKTGDSDCYVLLAEGDYGKYKIWFDPDHGYNIARARVLKKQDDIAWRGLPLGPPAAHKDSKHPNMKKTLSFCLENVKFKNINGLWLAVSADFRTKITFVSGRTSTADSSLTCDNIVIDPEYDVNDFKPDNIVEGTLVSIVPSQIKYRWIDGKPVEIKYEWINGKPVEKVNRPATEQIDKIK